MKLATYHARRYTEKKIRLDEVEAIYQPVHCVPSMYRNNKRQVKCEKKYLKFIYIRNQYNTALMIYQQYKQPIYPPSKSVTNNISHLTDIQHT